MFVAQEQEKASEQPVSSAETPADAAVKTPAEAAVKTPVKPSAEKPAAPGKPGAKEPSPIFVIPSPGGLMVTLEDAAALDEFERLLNQLSESAANGGHNITVFYLKHAKASAVADTLKEIIISGNMLSSPTTYPTPYPMSSPPGSSSSSSLAATSALALSQKFISSGIVQITADNRLNALVVQANPAAIR